MSLSILHLQCVEHTLMPEDLTVGECLESAPIAIHMADRERREVAVTEDVEAIYKTSLRRTTEKRI